MIINFTGGVLPYKKHRYQEGNEVDCELKCSNGSVMVRKSSLLCGKLSVANVCRFFASPKGAT